MQPLVERYWSTFEEEGPIELEAFLDQVAAGKHGEYTRQDILDFIDEMHGAMLANIELKATEGPQYEAMREFAIRQTEEQMERLRRKFRSDDRRS